MDKELREDICYDWLDADIYKKKNMGKRKQYLWVSLSFMGSTRLGCRRYWNTLPVGKNFHYQRISHMGRERDKKICPLYNVQQR